MEDNSIVEKLGRQAFYLLETPLESALSGISASESCAESLSRLEGVLRSLINLRAPSKIVRVIESCHHITLQNIDEAKLILDSIYSPESVSSCYLMGLIIEAEGSSEEALRESGKSYEKASEILRSKEGQDALARHILKGFYRLSDRFDCTIHMKDLAAYHPAAAALMGGIELRKGDIHKAIYYLDDARRDNKMGSLIRPIRIDILTALGDAYYQAGDLPRAAEAYRTLLKIDPKNSHVKSQLRIVEQEF